MHHRWKSVSLANWVTLSNISVTLTGRFVFCKMHKFVGTSGLKKNLNSSLPFGQVALKFCLPWTSLRLLFLRFSWQTTCPLGKWEWKVTCPTGKSTGTCPGQLDNTFFEPWTCTCKKYYCNVHYKKNIWWSMIYYCSDCFLVEMEKFLWHFLSWAVKFVGLQKYLRLR